MVLNYLLFEIQEIILNISSRTLAEVVQFLLHFMVEALNEIRRVSKLNHLHEIKIYSIVKII